MEIGTYAMKLHQKKTKYQPPKKLVQDAYLMFSFTDFKAKLVPIYTKILMADVNEFFT